MRSHGLTLRFRWLSFLTFCLTAVALLGVANRGARAANEDREADDHAACQDAVAPELFWIVSSRGVGNPESDPADAASRLRFYQSRAVGGCSPISLDDFMKAMGGDEPVVVWIHGNRMDFQDAVRSAADLKRVLDRLAQDRRYVLLAWSWPADRIVRGIRQDSRIKSCRSLQEAALLAHWIERTLHDRTVILVGYSFGAQTALKTAALLGGSQRRESANRAVRPEPITVRSSTSGNPTSIWSADWVGSACPVEAVFASACPDSEREHPAALHLRLLAAAAACPAGSLSTWLGDGAAEPEFIGVTVNRADPALRWYTHLWSHGGPQALGAVGPRGIPSALEDAVAVKDVTCQVGRTHDWEVYLHAAGFQALLRQALCEPERR